MSALANFRGRGLRPCMVPPPTPDQGLTLRIPPPFNLLQDFAPGPLDRIPTEVAHVFLVAPHGLQTSCEALVLTTAGPRSVSSLDELLQCLNSLTSPCPLDAQSARGRVVTTLG